MRRVHSETGFTMVEILVALLVSSLVLGAIFSTFFTHHKTYLVQDDVADLQQNLRATMDFMAREIQMAGYDPTESDNFGFQNLAGVGDPDYGRYTGVDGIAFLADNGASPLDDNGVVDNTGKEQLAFRLDVKNDGSAKVGAERDFVLRKYDTGAVKWQPLADNIEAVEFFYLLSDGTQTVAPNAAQLEMIRAVQLTLLARAANEDREYTDNQVYTPPGVAAGAAGAAVWGPFNDNRRRRMLSRTILCRNMGLPETL